MSEDGKSFQQSNAKVEIGVVSGDDKKEYCRDIIGVKSIRFLQKGIYNVIIKLLKLLNKIQQLFMID